MCRRDEILEILKLRFIEKFKANLPIFGIPKINLRDFTTTEKDMKRGQSRFPPDQFRQKEEDLIRERLDTAMVKPEVIDNTFAMQDDYDQNVALRNKQYQESKDFDEPNDDDDDEEQNDRTVTYQHIIVIQSMRNGGSLIFTRLKDQVRLQDFVIRRMIGKGTFGKVFIVQNKNTNKIYAMKCIRKDIIIDNEQYDNIKLEKDILFNIDHPFIVNMEYVF